MMIAQCLYTTEKCTERREGEREIERGLCGPDQGQNGGREGRSEQEGVTERGYVSVLIKIGQEKEREREGGKREEGRGKRRGKCL